MADPFSRRQNPAPPEADLPARWGPNDTLAIIHLDGIPTGPPSPAAAATLARDLANVAPSVSAFHRAPPSPLSWDTGRITKMRAVTPENRCV